MKCKNISNKINNFVVQNLKKIKLSGSPSSKMPSMSPKDKTTASTITVVDSNKKYSCSTTSSSSSSMTSTTTTTTNHQQNILDNKTADDLATRSRLNVDDEEIQRATNNSLNLNRSSSIFSNTSNSSLQSLRSISSSSSATSTVTTNSSSNILNNGQPQHQNHHQKKRGVNDFRFGKSIGEGSFSTVYVAKDIYTNKEYAIKVCDKHFVIKEKKVQNIKTEREVMNLLTGVPGFVQLFCTFQDNKSLYFAMNYVQNGDLLPYINKMGSFDLECSRHYAAELVLALENMHSRGIIHRDLKPENILLDDDMHILIADFGSAKLLENNVGNNGYDDDSDNANRNRKCSFVGTAQYVSPELLKGSATTKSSDLWALGCIIYQMISGLPPFRSNVEYKIFQKIQKLDLSFPEGFDETAKDLVQKLLVIDPTERLGANDANDVYTSIREHPFFADVNFDTLLQTQPQQISPYLPGGDLRDEYRIPDHLEPGLDDRQLQRLLGIELGTSNFGEKQNLSKTSIANLNEKERETRLRLQSTDKYNHFADGEVILKQGFVNKRKGLFARKRMLMLTTGPRLIYIDPVTMVKKGEIPWTPELRVEPKNFKIFFVHTPNRTYHLEEPEGYALNWCRDIEDVRIFTYGEDKKETPTTTTNPPATTVLTSST